MPLILFEGCYFHLRASNLKDSQLSIAAIATYPCTSKLKLCYESVGEGSWARRQCDCSDWQNCWQNAVWCKTSQLNLYTVNFKVDQIVYSYIRCVKRLLAEVKSGLCRHEQKVYLLEDGIFVCISFALILRVGDNKWSTQKEHLAESELEVQE